MPYYMKSYGPKSCMRKGVYPSRDAALATLPPDAEMLDNSRYFLGPVYYDPRFYTWRPSRPAIFDAIEAIYAEMPSAEGECKWDTNDCAYLDERLSQAAGWWPNIGLDLDVQHLCDTIVSHILRITPWRYGNSQRRWDDLRRSATLAEEMMREAARAAPPVEG